MLHRLLLVLFLLIAPAAFAQQGVTSLVADELRLNGTTGIVAEGNVVILADGVRLEASRVTYDRANDLLTIDGPIRLTQGTEAVILADAAMIDGDLQNGIIQSARMVLDQQLQLAAAEIQMVGGRYTQLYKTVASSCQVCEHNPVPLWQIRARRVVHDRQERQLLFDNAQLRVLDVPVLWVPRLRLPDPTLERATGFLIPRIRSNSRLGFGIKAPYFIRLGDHRDLTFTPYLSSSTATLEWRYRQAFRNGDLELRGAVTSDDLTTRMRGYLFAEGRFDLPRDTVLEFDTRVTSDKAYLTDYGYATDDRLISRIALSRTRQDSHFGTALSHIYSLRDSEDNDTIPSIIGDATYRLNFTPALLGGRAELSLGAHAHYRRSDTAGDDGRDLARLDAGIAWRRNHLFSNGMVAAALLDMTLRYYSISQGAPTDDDGLFHSTGAGVELRWPHRNVTSGGAVHIIEPVAQIYYSDTSGRPVNEDSTLLEFDEGNLFSDNRFPGVDGQERGLRANLGLSWTRYAPGGWSFGVTVGRIYRQDDPGDFSPGSGLTGTSSDWLLSGQLETANGLTLLNRSLFDDQFRFTRNETRLGWNTSRLSLATTYVWMDPAPAESRPQTSEWALDARYRLDDRWSASTDWRYDFVADRAARIGIGLEYKTECVTVDLSVARRFTSSTSVKPTTDFGLSVSLTGFGSGSDGRAVRHSCSG